MMRRALALPNSRQRGATLLVTLVMLVVMTLFVVSAVKLANINLRIVGNYQWHKAMEAMANTALEQIISSSANFSSTATEADICSDGSVVAAGTCTILSPEIGTVTAPVCLASGPATGYTKKKDELTPDDNDWQLTATVTDSLSGAKVTITRGTRIRMLAGNCPE